MKILGIIAEYNPFHIGHLYHMREAKKRVMPDITIIVMSGNYVQRGEMAIIDKWTRAKIAVEQGADLVIELPLVYAVESADYFASSSMYLLNLLQTTDIVFGSESADVSSFKEIAYTIKENEEQYNTLVKNYMKEGMRYPDACNQALSSLLHKEVKTPNDLLGLAYTKEIINNDYPIAIHALKRTNDYHATSTEAMSSATSLRIALKNNEDVSSQLPCFKEYKDNHFFDMNQFFPYLKYSIMTHDHLEDIHLVDEGIENLLKEKIMEVSNTDELIDTLTSKRYTRSRISRMLIHILLNNSKEEVKKGMELKQIRPLAFSKKGAQYLRSIKKDCPLPITTKILDKNDPTYTIEQKGTLLLSMLDGSILEKERKSIPYIKNDV